MDVVMVCDVSPAEVSFVADSIEPDTAATQVGIISRPPNQLHDLPVRFRWEACRRHPYYLVFWSNAVLYRRSGSDTPAAQLLLRQAAVLMLAAIGVTGEPVDPAKSFDELDGGEYDPGFLSGAVQPMTLRAVAMMLINALPQAERYVLGGILITSAGDDYVVAGDDANRSWQKLEANLRLAQLPSPALDSYPDAPLFYVHLGASQRTIVRDVEEQVRRWKGRQGIAERRVHVDKLQSYLEVWDQREGWTGNGYSRSQEHSLADIVQRSKEQSSTVANRYRAAFQMITGHEFSPALWWRLFGPLKFSSLFADPAEVLSRPIRRHLQSPVSRPVPESAVAPRATEGHASGLVGAEGAVDDDLALTELILDLEALFNRGLSNEEIARRLDATPAEVEYARARVAEFRKIRKQGASPSLP